MTLKKSQSSDPEADTLVLGLDSACCESRCEQQLQKPPNSKRDLSGKPVHIDLLRSLRPQLNSSLILVIVNIQVSARRSIRKDFSK